MLRFCYLYVKTHMTEQEFAYLSDRIRGKLTALARRFNRASGCDADAEDIVQDALLTLWQLSEQGDGLSGELGALTPDHGISEI